MMVARMRFAEAGGTRRVDKKMMETLLVATACRDDGSLVALSAGRRSIYLYRRRVREVVS